MVSSLLVRALREATVVVPVGAYHADVQLTGQQCEWVNAKIRTTQFRFSGNAKQYLYRTVYDSLAAVAKFSTNRSPENVLYKHLSDVDGDVDMAHPYSRQCLNCEKTRHRTGVIVFAYVAGSSERQYFATFCNEECLLNWASK